MPKYWMLLFLSLASLSEASELERPILSNTYALAENILMIRGSNESYNSYLAMVSTVKDHFEYFESKAPRTAWMSVLQINKGINKTKSGHTLLIQNIRKNHALATTQSGYGSSIIAGIKPGPGAASVISLSPFFYGFDHQERGVILAHELGHVVRASLGVQSPNTGAKVAFGGSDLYRRLGWWKEELENVGLILNKHARFSENAYRLEVGLPLMSSYVGLTAHEYRRAYQFYEFIRMEVEPGEHFFQQHGFSMQLTIRDFLN